MSIHLDWLKTGRAPRGTPARRGGPRRLVGIGLIAGLALLQAGCQSGPFSGCGSCNSCGFLRRTTARVFNRPGGCSSCGSSVMGDSGVEVSSPSTVIAPSVSPGSTYSTPSSQGTVPSNVPLPENPTILEKAPSASPGRSLVPNSSSTANPGARPTSYFGRTFGRKTAVRLDSGLATEPTSAGRPARQSPRDAATSATTNDEDNPLDHLPPLGLPGEVTQSSADSPAPSASRPEGKPGAAPDSAAATASSATEGDGVRLLPGDLMAEPEAAPAAGTGIARFAPVDPKLAGGSVPSSAGLAWLAEKGYRTVLDLRPAAEVPPAFIAEVAAKGLRYLALPVSLDKLDQDPLTRFQFELAAPEARPLFFFDGDGSRAGALWYVRRVAVDREDAQIARREAEEIGLKDPAAWGLATAFVDRLEAARAHPARTRTGAADPPVPPAAASSSEAKPSDAPRVSGGETAPAPAPAGDSIITSDGPAKAPASLIPPLLGTQKTASTSADGSRPADSIPFKDSMSWRPLAAMILTGLSLPLAYWTRTAIPDAIARVRASLPAPAPRPRSLPHESGE
jgi:protein tyrosine phosphatase (PTP) superfamily phosphohydrolase (DUF442 family)